MKIDKSGLKNDQTLEFSDINIFVGPNGVGKTTLMNEIRDFFCEGKSATAYWVANLENSSLKVEDASILLRHIKKNVEISDHGEEIKKYTLEHSRDNLGRYGSRSSSEVYSEGTYNNLVSLSKKGEVDVDSMSLLDESYLVHRMFIGYENTSHRLNLQGEQSVTDTKTPFSNVINVIMQNDEFQASLNDAFQGCFGHNLLFSTHRGAIIETLVSKANQEEIKEVHRKKIFDEAEKFKKEKGITTIDKVGDGMRAGAKLFFSLFNPDSNIIFIDEPEVFIHPKQKIKIAKELKKLARENKKQLFISTHDATLLSGLIDNTEDEIKINIFYIKERNTIIPLSEFLVSDGGITPTTKQPKNLQSLFHDGTVFTESPNDRCFYENAIGEIFKEELCKKDIVFTDTFGASGAVTVALFVRNSEIRATFIFDNDVLSEKKGKQQSLSRVYEILGGEENLAEMLLNISTRKEETIKELERFGIFIVPNGELQSWSSKIGKNDDGFPYNLIQEMIENPTEEFKIFSKKIIDFLTPSN